MTKPSTNGANGRDADGRFAAGNPGGPGNPYSLQVAKLRRAMLRGVSEKDIRRIVSKLVEMAADGNVSAAREVLDRCLGRPVEQELAERLANLESTLSQQQGAEQT